MFDACRSVKDTGRVGGTVVRDTDFPDVVALARARRAMRPCYDIHPGICKADPLFKSVKRRHDLLRRALSELGCPKGDSGKSFFLFAGHSRKRDARNALAFDDPGHVKADTYRATCVSDQADVRLGLKTFTLLDYQLMAPAGSFDLQGKLSLRRSARDTLEEVFSHGLVRGMFTCGHKWWVAYKLDVAPVPGVHNRVRLVGARSVRPCCSVRPEKGVERQDDGDALEAACDGVLGGAPKLPAKPSTADADAAADLEDALDAFLSDVVVTGEEAASEQSSDPGASDAGDDCDDDLGHIENGEEEEASDSEEFSHLSFVCAASARSFSGTASMSAS